MLIAILAASLLVSGTLSAGAYDWGTRSYGQPSLQDQQGMYLQHQRERQQQQEQWQRQQQFQQPQQRYGNPNPLFNRGGVGNRSFGD
jgi:hypothetical protein